MKFDFQLMRFWSVTVRFVKDRHAIHSTTSKWIHPYRHKPPYPNQGVKEHIYHRKTHLSTFKIGKFIIFSGILKIAIPTLNTYK